MSQINVDTIKKADGTGSLTVPAESGTVVTTASPSLGRRNLIINGAMQVAQRGTSVSGITAGGYYTVDRFDHTLGTLGTWTSDQSSDAPDGFANSLKLTCTTADASPASNDYIVLFYKVEAQDLQMLQYGTSGAKTATISFWVKSNKTGSASFGIRQPDNSNKQYTPSYTISSADTWEYKTFTIPADTSGVINNDNGNGFQIEWWLNSGSAWTTGTNQTTWTTGGNPDRNPSNLGVGGATSDYFAITGVQLEVGSVATPFEHRSFGEEMELCRRYYFRLINAANEVYGQGFNYGVYVRTAIHPQTTAFRALPSIEYVGPTTFYRKGTNATNNVNTTGNPWEIVASNKNTIFMQSQISDTSEDGVSGSLYLTGTGCHVSFNAEL